MVISFVKHSPDKVKFPEYWYLDYPTWRGDTEELRLPTSFNGLIEEESGIISKQLSFDVSEHVLLDGKSLKKVMHEELDGGRYDSLYGEVFICDMLLLFFPSGYPDTIYYRIRE
jgi:hypothetical protein